MSVSERVSFSMQHSMYTGKGKICMQTLWVWFVCTISVKNLVLGHTLLCSRVHAAVKYTCRAECYVCSSSTVDECGRSWFYVCMAI